MLDYLMSLTEKEIKKITTTEKTTDILNIGDYIIYDNDLGTDDLEKSGIIFRIITILEKSYVAEYNFKRDDSGNKEFLSTVTIPKIYYPIKIKRLTYEDFIKIKIERLRNMFFPGNISKVRSYLTKVLNDIYGEERYEIKNIENPRTIKSLDNGDIIAIPDSSIIHSEITLYYPEINISNSIGTTHTIRDLFFNFSLVFMVNKRRILIKNFRIQRTTFRDDEYIEEHNVFYVFSHCQTDPRPWLKGITGICFGHGSANPMIQRFRSGMGQVADLEMLFYSINAYLEWESIEGTPYISIRSLGSKQTKYEINDLSEMFLNRTSNTVITILMNEMKDYPLEKLSEFSLTHDEPTDTDFASDRSANRIILLHFFNFNIDKRINEILTQLKEENPIMMLDPLFCYIYGGIPTLLDADLENSELMNIIDTCKKENSGIMFRNQLYPVKIEIMNHETLASLRKSLKKTVHPDFIFKIKQSIGNAFIHYLTTEKPYVI